MAQQLTPDQQAAVDRIRETTVAVRAAEEALERVRLKRRGAMMAASEAGVTTYRIAQEAETSHASAWRILNEYDEKWRAEFEARLDERADPA